MIRLHQYQKTSIFSQEIDNNENSRSWAHAFSRCQFYQTASCQTRMIGLQNHLQLDNENQTTVCWHLALVDSDCLNRLQSTI